MNFEYDIFKNIPPAGHLYFFYGLAFFFLGISIVFSQKRSSDFIISGSLWILAAFGVTHGIYAWLELFILLQNQYAVEGQTFLLKGMKILAYTMSFLFLLQFGLALTCHTIKNKRKKLITSVIPVVLVFFWAVSLWNQVSNMGSDFLNVAFISSRYTFALVGSLVTAYGLWMLSQKMKDLGSAVAKKLFYTSIVFIFYGIVAGTIPSYTVLPYVFVRVEVLHVLSAVLITYLILSALNVFDMETKRKLKKQVKQFEQSEKLVSIGRLAAGIAHEINNPLTNASLNVEILKDKLKEINNPDILKRLESMEKNISKAATIAKELLQFSRNTEPDMVNVDINDIIRGSLTLMQHKFKNVNVHTSLSEVPDIIGDPVKLEQVIMNILDNAHHAMHGNDEIWIESLSHDGFVEIKIIDSGKGISRENLPKIFDPFFTTKEIGVGTGLGLSICYGIIHQHDGNINIDSIEGKGTTVTITIPATSEKRRDKTR